jgi:tRNA U34 5-methylaminomethyl-2-thiouridine-forming methyltransferase MnmC
MKPVLTETLDGSHTLFLEELGEHYHSTNGAIGESMHVFIRAGFEYCTKNKISVFEAGFGTGLNALLTAIKSAELGRHTSYVTIEKHPLDRSIVNILNYPAILSGDAPALFTAIHEASWNRNVPVNEYFEIMKIHDDLTGYMPDYMADVIYFDAFSPSRQPEMWSPGVIMRMADMLNPGTLRSSGLEVTLLPGAPGKREMIRAIKI